MKKNFEDYSFGVTFTFGNKLDIFIGHPPLGCPGSLPFPFPSFPLLWGLPSAWQLVLAAPREGPFWLPTHSWLGQDLLSWGQSFSSPSLPISFFCFSSSLSPACERAVRR